MKLTDDDHDTYADYLDRQEDEMPPVERWADACMSAIRAVEMASFEEQAEVSINEAAKLMQLALRLAGRGDVEPFTAKQIEFLSTLGVRVEPRKHRDGTSSQVAFNDRAAKVETRLVELRENI